MASIIKVPEKLRRITREEAHRLGVSYSAKRRVDATLKRITKRTKLYTDRQVFQSRHKATKEAVTKLKHVDLGHGRRMHKEMSKAQLTRVLNKEKKAGRKVQLMVYGHRANARYEGKAEGWISLDLTSPEDALELMKRMTTGDRGFAGFNKRNPAKKFSVVTK